MKSYLPVAVEAVRWMTEDDYAMTRVIHPELIYSQSGNHYYLSHKNVNSEEWLPVDPRCEGVEGKALPFAFWEVKSGRRVVLDWDKISELSPQDKSCFRVAINAAYRKQPHLLGFALRSYGVLEIEVEEEGRVGKYKTKKSHLVNKGDWIVKNAIGEITVMTNEVFEKLMQQTQT